MFSPGNLVFASFSLLHIIALLIGLWIASRFEPRIASLLQAQRSASLGPPHRTILWLLLGSVFAVPVSDLLGLFQILIDIVSPASWGLAEGASSIFWGSAPPGVFLALSSGTTIAVYATASLLLWRYFRDHPSPSPVTPTLSRADRILVVLACAGMTNRIVSSLIQRVVFIDLPAAIRPPQAGIPGFVGGWLLGFILVFALAELFSLQVQSEEN